MSNSSATHSRLFEKPQASSLELSGKFASTAAANEKSRFHRRERLSANGGWRNSRQSVKRWLGELQSITESTAWGQYFGTSVKLPCGNVTVGVPELSVRRWSNTSIDPMASSCAPADPYISSNASFVASLKRLSIGQTVTFAGQFCAIPDSVNDDVIYFVFSKLSPTR